MEKIPSWIERLLLPKLNEITSLRSGILVKFEAADARFDFLEVKIPVLK